MELYFFLIFDEARTFDDENGTLLPDEQSARQHATRIIAELKADPSFAASNGHIAVLRTGQEIFRVHFSSVPSA